MTTTDRTPWRERAALAILIALLGGIVTMLLQPGLSWLVIPISIAGALAWTVLETRIKLRRPLRDPVREESIAATEAALRIAEAEIEAKAESRL